ncbi:MAG: hypothetical protein P4L98_24280 [Ancalomicrobiaceae bacterium]|nr:hypothetical protein [Ancalomicrobiaceae bacterium]
MKTFNVILIAAALASVSTAAFAQPSDSAEQQIAHQLVLGNVKASNDSGAAAAVVEGRQAAANVSFSATDRVYVDLQNVRDRNKPTNNNY